MPKFPDIQAVTFDVGGTLIRPWPSVGHVYAEAAAAHGHPDIEPDTLNRQFGAAWRAKKDFDHSRAAWLDLVEKTFAGSVASTRVRGFFDDIYDRFTSPKAWHLFEDVRPTVEALRGWGVKVGIISNWDERLRPLLAALELSPHFDVIVISIEAGAAKPAHAIFEQAAIKLGVPTPSILHVGDNWDEDVLGARAAGLTGVLLDRKGTEGREGSISTLRGVTDLAVG